MAIQIKHAFTSAKGDGGDATLVRPSNWNAAHTTSMASGKLIGRSSVGAGEFEEITVSAAVMAALSASTGPEFLAALGLGGFSTGDVKWSFRASADAGWVIVNTATGTIGDASSSATFRANADVLALWTQIYDNVSDTYATVSGGRTGNAANDFNAHKTMRLNLQGRSPIGAGNGTTGLTTRGLGTTGGEETTALTTSLIPNIPSSGTMNGSFSGSISGSTSSVIVPGSGSGVGGGGAFGTTSTASVGGSCSGSCSVTGTINSAGTGGAAPTHNNMPPFVALYAHVKL